MPSSFAPKLLAAAFLLAPTVASAQWPATDLHLGVGEAIDRGVQALLLMQETNGGFHYPGPLGRWDAQSLQAR